MSNGYTGDVAGSVMPTEQYYLDKRTAAHSGPYHFQKGWDDKSIGVYAHQDYLDAMKKWRAGDMGWQSSGIGETYSQLGEATEAELMRAYNRQIGQMRGRLGFAASSGAGGTGYWDSARIALESKAMGQLGVAATASERIEAGAKADWLNKKDAQAYGMEMQATQHQYRLAELKYQAELNDPSWWQDFGSIIGSVAAIGGAFFTGGASLMALPAQIAQPAITPSMIPAGW